MKKIRYSDEASQTDPRRRKRRRKKRPGRVLVEETDLHGKHKTDNFISADSKLQRLSKNQKRKLKKKRHKEKLKAGQAECSGSTAVKQDSYVFDAQVQSEKRYI